MQFSSLVHGYLIYYVLNAVIITVGNVDALNGVHGVNAL